MIDVERESARDGVPAHVTVLYPFLPPAEIGSAARPRPAPGAASGAPGQGQMVASFPLG